MKGRRQEGEERERADTRSERREKGQRRGVGGGRREAQGLVAQVEKGGCEMGK